MFVNGIPMLVTVSRNLLFGTVEELPSRSVSNLVKAITRVTQVYKRAGFRVTLSLMDGELEPLCGDLADAIVTLNTTGRDKHVGDIERFIRTIKERMRATYNMLPFEKIPQLMVVEMAKSAVFWLNSFPPRKQDIKVHESQNHYHRTARRLQSSLQT